MKRKISFIIFDESGKDIRKLGASKQMLYGLCLCFGFCAVLLAFIAYDYYDLKKELAHKHVVERKVAEQTQKIYQQQKQIEKFANEINTLKSKVVKIDKFQKKMRIIANLDHSDEQDGLFGVGGPLPEDLDPMLSFKEHSSTLVREMYDQVDQLIAAAEHQEKTFEFLLEQMQEQRNLLACTPAIRPAKGWTSSKFGYRTSPFTNRKEFHKGMDIAAPKGTPVTATADGIVTYAGKKGLLGNLVVINHGYGFVTRYGHNSKILIKRGDRVKRGDIVAEVGNTGRSTGPHVHYEVRLNGVPVNPSNYIFN